MIRKEKRTNMKWISSWMTAVTMIMVAAAAPAGENPPGSPPAKVVVAQVHEQMVAENTPIVGTLSYDKVSNLSPEVSGQVQTVRFREGDRVKKDDILILLNTDFIERDIRLAEIRIEQIKVQIEKVEKDLARYKTLFQQEAASEKDYDDLEFTRRDLIQQQRMLNRQLDIQRLKKEKSVIRAPFDGIVLQKHAEAGDWVGTGVQICSIGSLHDLLVKVPIAEELLRYCRKGLSVDVTLHALDKTISGIVVGIVPIADPKTKNIMLKIQLPQLDTAIENMSATVRVPISPEKKLRMIPRDALVNFQGQDFVYTVKDGKSVIVPVHIVSFVGQFIGTDNPAVTDGMMVVVDGNQRLKPDQPVEAVSGNAPEKS